MQTQILTQVNFIILMISILIHIIHIFLTFIIDFVLQFQIPMYHTIKIGFTNLNVVWVARKNYWFMQKEDDICVPIFLSPEKKTNRCMSCNV